MGLLDDLEQEAQRRKATLDEAERLKAEREGVYKTQLEPGMQKLYEYLSKLTTNLGFLKPKIAVRHELPGYGPLVAYYEHEYDLRVSSQPTAKEITLAFNAVVASEECALVEVQGGPKTKALVATFQKYRLGNVGEVKKDDNGDIAAATFRPRGKIPMTTVLAADAESGQVRVSFTNFEALGNVLAKTFPAAQFNEALFDEVGRFLARESSTLFREALPDDYRKQLQQRIQQENLKRKWESKIALQQKEELEKMKREQSLKGRLDRAVEGVKEKAPSILDKVKGLFRKD